MARLARRFVSTVAMLLFCPVPVIAADNSGDDPAVAKDLTAVIALQGMPCGQVLRATKQGENDYLASCLDGNRYRVSVSPEGRVVVENLRSSDQ